MKKIVFILTIALFGLTAQAQTGDLTLGLKGAYITNHKGFLYGLDVAYQVSPLLEASFTGLMNSKINKKDSFLGYEDPDLERNISIYSGNLDLRFFLISTDYLGTGPTLGVQCTQFKIKMPMNNDAVIDDGTAWGFNIGWHIRLNVTENVKLNGGWRYTNATEDQSHHIFYLGVGYAFNLF